MMCFLDRVFCVNPQCTCSPGRKLTPEVEAAAARWWIAGGGDEDEVPIDKRDVCGARSPGEDGE